MRTIKGNLMTINSNKSTKLYMDWLRQIKKERNHIMYGMAINICLHMIQYEICTTNDKYTLDGITLMLSV